MGDQAICQDVLCHDLGLVQHDRSSFGAATLVGKMPGPDVHHTSLALLPKLGLLPILDPGQVKVGGILTHLVLNPACKALPGILSVADLLHQLSRISSTLMSCVCLGSTSHDK